MQRRCEETLKHRLSTRARRQRVAVSAASHSAKSSAGPAAVGPTVVQLPAAINMIPELYLHKDPGEEEADNSDTVFSSLETPGNFDFNFNNLFSVESTQDNTSVKMRSLPEFQSHQILLYPDDEVKQFWDLVVLMYAPHRLMSYTVTVTPYRVAFVEDDDLAWTVLDLVVDGLFGIDVVVNFFTPYFDISENLIVDKKKIALHYMFSWFLIDVVSCMPFQVVFDEQSDYGSLMRMGRLPRLYRIIKFSKYFPLRIARVFKAYRNRGKCLSLLSCCSRISAGFERIVYLLLVSLIVIHIVACMWYFVDHFDYPSVDSWVVKYKEADSPKLEIYLSACYWTITTLATVGFGDIVPASTLGRMYCSVVMLLGIVFYSYTIGTVTGLLGDFDRRQTKLHAKLTALQDIAKKYKLSHKFFKQLKVALEQDQYRVRKEREDVLNSLPKKLAARLTILMHKHLLRNNRFFKQRSLKFLQSLLPLLRPAKVAPEEVVYRLYEVCDESNSHLVYFVGRGRLAYFIDELHVHIVYEEIKDKDYFGDFEFFFADQRETNVKASTSCEILALGRDDLFNKLFPEFADLKIEMIVEAAATRDRLKLLREEAEQKRREQYKRAKGLQLTLSFNEIERLNEMQPSLRSELLFEEEEARPQLTLSVHSPQPGKSPSSQDAIVVQSFPNAPVEAPLFTKLLELTPRNDTSRKEEATQPAEPPAQDGKPRRSITSPQPFVVPVEKEEDSIEQRQTQVEGLRTLLNTHTLALLEQPQKAKDSDEVLKAYNRIEARLDRIEELLLGLTEAKRPGRRSSVTISPPSDGPGDLSN